MVKGVGTIFAQSTESTHDTTEFIHDKNRFSLATQLEQNRFETLIKIYFAGNIIFI